MFHLVLEERDSVKGTGPLTAMREELPSVLRSWSPLVSCD